MKAVIQFSGGKDSLACLYLNRDQIDEVPVMFGDTGATYPHVREFVIETCRDLGAQLIIVKPSEDVLTYTERVGLPSDVVPIWNTEEMAPFLSEHPRQMVQSAMKCCASMLFKPMYEAVREHGFDTVIRGAKACDRRVGVPDGHIDQGITYRAPLWDWTDADVFRYLDEVGARLAPHYPVVKSSMDCWCCTGHAPYEDFAARINYTRKHYPDLWPVLEDRLGRLKTAINHACEAMEV